MDRPQGKEKKVHYFYGFKDQVSLNTETEIITSVVPGRADEYDGHKFKKLVQKDLGKGIPVRIVTADKGYGTAFQDAVISVSGDMPFRATLPLWLLI